jgi:hypothetical protein
MSGNRPLLALQNLSITVMIIIIWTVTTYIQSANVHNATKLLYLGLQLLMMEIPAFPAIFCGVLAIAARTRT